MIGAIRRATRDRHVALITAAVMFTGVVTLSASASAATERPCLADATRSGRLCLLATVAGMGGATPGHMPRYIAYDGGPWQQISTGVQAQMSGRGSTRLFPSATPSGRAVFQQTPPSPFSPIAAAAADMDLVSARHILKVMTAVSATSDDVSPYTVQLEYVWNPSRSVWFMRLVHTRPSGASSVSYTTNRLVVAGPLDQLIETAWCDGTGDHARCTGRVERHVRGKFAIRADFTSATSGRLYSRWTLENGWFAGADAAFGPTTSNAGLHIRVKQAYASQ